MRPHSGTKAAEAPIPLFLTADDRTGALESGGAVADLGWEARFVPLAADDAAASSRWGHPLACRVADLASRHCHPVEARRRIEDALAVPAVHRCHKMDSGLRGNWAHDAAALAAAGCRVGVLASFPDAGRRCVDGTVFIHDVPVAESAFGRDPRSRLVSSRPADYLRAAGCEAELAQGDVVVLDAADNAELRAAAKLALAEQRLLVGTTGGIEAYVAALGGERPAEGAPLASERRPPRALPRPALVVCGSLHPLSRQQVAALPCRAAALHEHLPAAAALKRGEDVVLTTPERRSAIDGATAEAMASRVAATAWRWVEAGSVRTLVVLGGDTAEAVLGNRQLRILGSVDTGVPLSTLLPTPLDTPHRGGDAAPAIVTKGGGIGAPDTLAKLLAA